MTENASPKHDRLTVFFYRIIMPWNQAIIAVCCLLFIALFSYWGVERFHPLERPTPLIPLTPQKVAEWGVMPTRVDVGLDIIDFPVLDFVNNQFVFDGILWFEYDPALLALDTIGKFSFEKGEILQKSEPNTQLVESKLLARYDIRVRFTSDIEYNLFPFDDHTIFINLVNRTISPREMIFRSYSSFIQLPNQVSITGFELFGASVKTGYSESQLDKYESGKKISYPKVIFGIDFNRWTVRHGLVILLPMFLIFFVSLFALSFDPQKQMTTIMSIAMIGVSSLLAYRFVIENMSPKVGYFILSDQMFMVFLSAILIIFVFSIVIVGRGQLTRFIIIARGLLYLLLNISVLVAWYYFLFLYI